MGSFLEPKVQSTPPPQQAEFLTQIDNVNRLETKKVKQADGTDAIVTTRLPLTEEEQGYHDTLTRIRDDSTAWIEKLTNDPTASSIPWVNDYVTNYKATAMEGINAGATARTSQEEKALARVGQGDSTAAAITRNQRGSDISKQVAQLGRDEVGIRDNARKEALSSYGNINALASGNLGGLLSQLTSVAGQQGSQGLQGQELKQQYYNNVSQNTSNNNLLKMQASQAGLTNLSNLIAIGAAPFTGGLSLGAVRPNSAPMSAARSKANGITWN